MWRIIIILIFCVAVSQPAFASSEIRALLDAGDYAGARVQAETLQTAEGYALAAEALNGLVLLGEADDLNDTAKAARALAEKALALDPENYNGRLQQALADGFVTRTSGTLTAWRKKLPAKTFEMVSRLHAEYPESPRAGALLGAWHLGVIREVGEKKGSRWFGASKADGRKLYEAAIIKDPDDIIMQANYFMSLHVLDIENYDPSATRRALEDILIIPPKNDAETKIITRLNKIYAKTNDADDVKKLAGKFLDGKPF